jgi:hypothetical protein
MASTRDSRQRTQTTILEGGVPPIVTESLRLVGGDLEQLEASPARAIEAPIQSIAVEESLAIPTRRETNDPAFWPSDVRGMPHFRPQEEVDFASRQLALSYLRISVQSSKADSCGLGFRMGQVPNTDTM